MAPLLAHGATPAAAVLSGVGAALQLTTAIPSASVLTMEMVQTVLHLAEHNSSRSPAHVPDSCI